MSSASRMYGHQPSFRGSRRWNLVIWHSSMQNGLTTIWTLPGHGATCIPNTVGCCFCCRQLETQPDAKTARKGSVDPLNDQKSPHHLLVLGHPCGSRETRRRPRQPRCRGFMPHFLLHDLQEEDNCLFIHHSQNLALVLLVTPLGSASSIICAYKIRDRCRSLTKLVAFLRLQD